MLLTDMRGLLLVRYTQLRMRSNKVQRLMMNVSKLINRYRNNESWEFASDGLHEQERKRIQNTKCITQVVQSTETIQIHQDISDLFFLINTHKHKSHSNSHLNLFLIKSLGK